MKPKNILVVVGTRPNFVKITRFREVAKAYPNINLKIVHTGQHAQQNMADVFFSQFGMFPDFFLNIPASLSANSQIAHIMLELEKLVLTDFNPHWIVCVGDVNSTLAAALTANKLNIKLAHVESGLRSFDSSMPEEHNRILTDKVCDLYFVTEPSGRKNLLSEMVAPDKIFEVGNTMIDTLVHYEEKITSEKIIDKLILQPGSFILTTIHRPATVDTEGGLTKLLELFQELGKKSKLVFPMHPRTVNNLKNFNLFKQFQELENLIITEPLDYFAFQKLIKDCRFVITDSGGIQEETTFLQKPCLTLRPNTERPITCEIGSNTLVKFDLEDILNEVAKIENGTYKKGRIPEGWDGKASERIMKILASVE